MMMMMMMMLNMMMVKSLIWPTGFASKEQNYDTKSVEDWNAKNSYRLLWWEVQSIDQPVWLGWGNHTSPPSHFNLDNGFEVLETRKW